MKLELGCGSAPQPGRPKNAVILIPWRASGDDRRQQLWDWTRYFLEKIGWPIVTGDGEETEFSRASAINRAARDAGDWDVALIGDADTVQDADSATRGAARALEVGFCIPWTHRVKLSQAGTEAFVRRGPGAVSDADRDRRDGTNPHGGGATICVSREAFDAVGGLDERFVGYGNEDLAFRAAVETLVIGSGAPREHGIVWHLWHRPRPRVGSRLAATPANQERWKLYQAARWKPKEMRDLVRV